ncbi:hypothetical protein CBOVI_05870 [Corynebacterium bovis DSM 20582 = CIP 54.80]|nr:hypothetical protein CBOVI_05870 [Corynebacterium bovis DSM 20582 = CIP 54.80]
MQGRLFDLSVISDETPVVGYVAPTVAQIAGITYRQLDFGTRTGLVTASITPRRRVRDQQALQRPGHRHHQNHRVPVGCRTVAEGSTHRAEHTDRPRSRRPGRHHTVQRRHHHLPLSQQRRNHRPPRLRPGSLRRCRPRPDHRPHHHHHHAAHTQHGHHHHAAHTQHRHPKSRQGRGRLRARRRIGALIIHKASRSSPPDISKEVLPRGGAITDGGETGLSDALQPPSGLEAENVASRRWPAFRRIGLDIVAGVEFSTIADNLLCSFSLYTVFRLQGNCFSRSSAPRGCL